MESGEVEAIIEKLIDSIHNKGNGHVEKLKEADLISLSGKAKECLMKDSMLLKVEAPVVICGNILGKYKDLLEIFRQMGSLENTRYLFLGNYVDKGKQSVETVCLLMALKVRFPDRIFLLRGNHECESINRIYGFLDECKKKYTIKLFKEFNRLFNHLPVAAVVEDRVFCVSSGISPELQNLTQIDELARPIEVPDFGLLCDLLWSDPAIDVQRWDDNPRGVSYQFGPTHLREFLQKNKLQMVVRSHQPVEGGFEPFDDGRLFTIFSVPNDVHNDWNLSPGVVIQIDDMMLTSIHKIVPFQAQTSQ